MLEFQDHAQGAELTLNQKKKIQLYLQDDGALTRAIANGTKKNNSSTAFVLKRGNIRQKMRKIIEILRSKITNGGMDKLVDLVCNKYDYCKNRNKTNFVYNIIGVIIGFFDVLSSGIAYLVFLFKQEFFDDLCECDQK